jgi:hypothetical protein
MSNLWPEKDDSPAGKGDNTAKRANFDKFYENYPDQWSWDSDKSKEEEE